MNIILKIDRILSYQTLVYKNGSKTFKKLQYVKYMNELYAAGLSKMTHKELAESKDVSIKIIYYYHDKRIGDLDNITKPIMDTLEYFNIIKNDRYVTKLDLEKIYSKDSTYDVIELEILTN